MIKFMHYKELFEAMEASDKFKFSLKSRDGGLTFSVAIVNSADIIVAKLEPDFAITINDLSDSEFPRIFIGEDRIARIDKGRYSLTLPIAFKAVSNTCNRCKGHGITYELVGGRAQHTTCTGCNGTGARQ